MELGLVGERVETFEYSKIAVKVMEYIHYSTSGKTLNIRREC